ncbi:hypothetical protein DK842_16275 [Chromobacterium phragmitis]|uniref:Iminophenyl-pyruvate dimer synthase domain-containing protein n=1 Tax=Chromobacterium phragmitis TaxID=2202141 RepID=A0A344UN50_9NEIS|nr:ferritin-like domain-containing protein [Chromobacterium phragmitis]AXE31316.1 hypothetical protein DK842_16275 [Chromobacterium phragmitis]AXE36698.1 hypothetical protein DK843_21800 [Chromobacterium phragmitis]
MSESPAYLDKPHCAPAPPSRQILGADGFRATLRQALRREHGLIPPLLAARFSLKPGAHRPAAALLEAAVAAQFRRMSLAACLLRSAGESPCLTDRGFLPDYPESLPLSAAHAPPLGIERFAPRLLRETLLPHLSPPDGAPGPYRSLRRRLESGDAAIVLAASGNQALAALERPSGRDALLADELSDFASHQQDRDFDHDGVWAMPANASILHHSASSAERKLLTRFAACYARMLSALEPVLGDSRLLLEQAEGPLFDLRLLAAGLMNPAAFSPVSGSNSPPLGLCFVRPKPEAFRATQKARMRTCGLF